MVLVSIISYVTQLRHFPEFGRIVIYFDMTGHLTGNYKDDFLSWKITNLHKYSFLHSKSGLT
jgi:hypothetical protein